MPSEPTKWRDLVTIFKPSEVKSASPSSSSTALSSEWTNKSTLWKPFVVTDSYPPLPPGEEYIRGASVSDLYPYYFEEGVGIGFGVLEVSVATVPEYAYEDEAQLNFSLLNVDVLFTRNDYFIPVEATQLNFSLLSLEVEEIMKVLPPEEASVTFSLLGVSVFDGVTHSNPIESVNLRFTVENVEVI